MKSAFLRLALATTFSLSLAACDSADDSLDTIGDEVDELYNCARICQAYSDCENIDDFDVTQCTDDCEDMADMSQAFEEAAEACQACIDGGEVCDSNDFQCDMECAGVVP